MADPIKKGIKRLESEIGPTGMKEGIDVRAPRFTHVSKKSGSVRNLNVEQFKKAEPYDENHSPNQELRTRFIKPSQFQGEA